MFGKYIAGKGTSVTCGFDHVQIIIVEVAEGWDVLVLGFALVQQKLDLRLKLSLLGHLAHTTCSDRIFLIVKASAIGTHVGDGELDNVDVLEHVLQGLDYMSVASGIIRTLARIERGGKGTLISLEAKQEDVDGGALDEGLRRRTTTRLCRTDLALSIDTRSSSSGESATSAHATSSTHRLAAAGTGSLQLHLSLAGLLLRTAHLLHRLTFLDSEAADKALITLDIRHVQVDLFLKHDQFFVHLYFQAEPGSLNFRLQLNHLLFLVTANNNKEIRTNF